MYGAYQMLALKDSFFSVLITPSHIRGTSQNNIIYRSLGEKSFEQVLGRKFFIKENSIGYNRVFGL